MFVVGGVVLVQFHNCSNYSSHFEKHIEANAIYYGKLSEPVRLKKNTVQCKVSICKIFKNDTVFNVSGAASISIAKDEQSVSLLNRDKIAFYANWKKIESPHNPFQFDFKKFMEHKGIFSQSYIGAKNWTLLERNSNNIYSCSNLWRNKFLSLIENSGIKGDELSVLSALTVGSKDLISKDLKHYYSSAGAMHILAVSGLHVGIIYWVIEFLLGLFFPSKRFIHLKVGISLSFLWLYALISGLSPSVLRASTMLSFLIFGYAINKKTNVYNNLAASAFFLLFIDPFLIVQAGFQLSYFAVLGILFFQPKIFQWIKFKNLFLNKIWMLSSVSIAAQLGTFPLGLFYFHQFPVYFIVTNLIVVPGAFVALIGSLLLLLFQLNTFSMKWIGENLDVLVGYINKFVQQIDGLPFSVIDGISISIAETSLIYTFILLFFLSLFNKKATLLISSLIVLFTVLAIDLKEDINLSSVTEIVFFSVKGHTATNIYLGNKNILIADKELFKNRDKLSFNIEPYWHAFDVKEVNFFDLDSTQTIEIDLIHQKIELNKQVPMDHNHFIQFINYKSIDFNENLDANKFGELLNSASSTKRDNRIILSSNLSKNQTEKCMSYFKKNNKYCLNTYEGAISIPLDSLNEGSQFTIIVNT